MRGRRAFPKSSLAVMAQILVVTPLRRSKDEDKRGLSAKPGSNSPGPFSSV